MFSCCFFPGVLKLTGPRGRSRHALSGGARASEVGEAQSTVLVSACRPCRVAPYVVHIRDLAWVRFGSQLWGSSTDGRSGVSEQIGPKSECGDRPKFGSNVSHAARACRHHLVWKFGSAAAKGAGRTCMHTPSLSQKQRFFDCAGRPSLDHLCTRLPSGSQWSTGIDRIQQRSIRIVLGDRNRPEETPEAFAKRAGKVGGVVATRHGL